MQIKSAKLKGFGKHSQQAKMHKVYTCALLAKDVRGKYLRFERIDFIMEKHIYDVKSGLNYTLADDGMYYPDLVLPQEENAWVGKYGLLRESHLKEHRNSLYMSLYLSGKLNKHLLEINEQAQSFVDEFVSAMAKAEGCDEKLKAKNQMEWVGLMNNYRACAEEVVLREVVYK